MMDENVKFRNFSSGFRNLIKFLPDFKLQNIFIYVLYGTNEEKKNKSNIHENANRKILGQKEELTHKFIVSFQTGSKVFGFIDVS
jgi:hypothetical protein